MKKILLLLTILIIPLVFVACFFTTSEKPSPCLYFKDLENHRFNGVLISEDQCIVVHFSDNKVYTSSLTPGDYRLSMMICGENKSDLPIEHEIYDHFVDISISLDEATIENGKTIQLDHFEPLTPSFEGTLPDNKSFGDSTVLYLFNETNPLLFGPFSVSETLYGMITNPSEAYLLTVQDPDNHLQFSKHTRDLFNKTSINLNEIEFADVLPIFVENSTLSPVDYEFTACAHQRPTLTLGQMIPFELSSELNEGLLFSSNGEYFWDIHLEKDGINYHLKNTQAIDILFGCYISIGERIDIRNNLRSDYSVDDTITIHMKDILHDCEDNLLCVYGDKLYRVEVSKDNKTLIHGEYGVNDTFSFKAGDPGQYTLKVSVNTGKWCDETVKINLFDAHSETHSGAFKVANSAGIGGWEKKHDGFYHISYDAMISGGVECYAFSPSKKIKRNNVHAVIGIEHQKRDEIMLDIGIGSPENPIRKMTFFNTINGGGPFPFPDEKIVLDISDLFVSDIPEEQECYIKIHDSTKTTTTGRLNSFSIEYEDTISGQKIITATDTPIETVDGSWISSQIKVATVPLIARSSHILSKKVPKQIDHSESIYFPPIANQGDTNACVAFSIAYYIGTFYNAKHNDYDLSKARWISPENSAGYPDKAYQRQILSPSFVYNQINRGEDTGSEFTDAIRIITRAGACSWENFPFTPDSYTHYPEESAWREASLNKCEDFDSENQWLYLRCHSMADIEYLKQLLYSGYLISIDVDPSQLANLTINDCWYTWNYFPRKNTHASTIVGYNDASQ